jgi:hypothetical protein
MKEIFLPFELTNFVGVAALQRELLLKSYPHTICRSITFSSENYFD